MTTLPLPATAPDSRAGRRHHSARARARRRLSDSDLGEKMFDLGAQPL